MSERATSRGGLLAGIDVGGSKIAVLIADAGLDACATRTEPTGIGPDGEAAFERIGEVLEATLAEVGGSPADLAAIGVGVPGQVDVETGVVSRSVNLGWHELPLGAGLERRYGVPARVENDVRAAAAGLYERRVLGDEEDLAYLSIGTGISAGVVLGGRLHRGRRGMAGEIGHVVLDPAGPVCPCGLTGCLEALAAGPSVARRAASALDDGLGRGSVLDVIRATRPLTAIDVYRAAAGGDRFSSDLVESTGRYVARAVHELVMTYDVRRVALGGGVAAAGPTFLEPILRGLDALRAASPLAREVLPADVVHLLADPSEAGPWGAVILARSGLPHDRRPATAAVARRGGE